MSDFIFVVVRGQTNENFSDVFVRKFILIFIQIIMEKNVGKMQFSVFIQLSLNWLRFHHITIHFWGF